MPAEIPQDSREVLTSIKTQAFTDLLLGRAESAEDEYGQQLDLLLATQDRDRRRYHEGGPLQSLGTALVNQGKRQEGLRSILLAFVEDVVSTSFDESRDLPVFRVLTEGFRISEEDAPAGTIYREQHITGICSEECWDEFLGGSPQNR